MATSGEEKFGNIFKVLSEHNFHLQVKDTMKCVRCQNILINAYQSQCGCRFCRKCVDEILNSGVTTCPGNTGDCKSEKLSNIAPDHRMNRKISKLLVKCPKQMCRYECQLIEMEEHIRLCTKKSVQCPCHDLGCNDEDLVEDKINEHLQTQSFNHWTMLMCLIGDLRNEVAQLRRTENVNKIEIELLRNEVRAKDEKIEETRKELTDKIRKCEVETEVLRVEIRAKDERVEGMRKEMTDKIRKCEIETEVLRVEMRAKDEMIKVMRDDTKSLKVEIKKGNLDSKIDAMSCEINGKIESIKNEKAELSGELANLNVKVEGFRVEVETMEKDQEKMAARMDEMKICLDGKIDETRFVWPVDKISKMEFGVISSEFFSPKINPYKIQLGLNNYNSQLRIWLRIYAGPNDEKLQWPFQAKVRVKVSNKAAPAVCMEDTKYLKIPRPPNDSFSFSNISTDPFLFPIVDLTSKNLLLSDCCIVECFIDLQ